MQRRSISTLTYCMNKSRWGIERATLQLKDTPHQLSLSHPHLSPVFSVFTLVIMNFINLFFPSPESQIITIIITESHQSIILKLNIPGAISCCSLSLGQRDVDKVLSKWWFSETPRPHDGGGFIDMTQKSKHVNVGKKATPHVTALWF